MRQQIPYMQRAIFAASRIHVTTAGSLGDELKCDSQPVNPSNQSINVRHADFVLHKNASTEFHSGGTPEPMPTCTMTPSDTR